MFYSRKYWFGLLLSVDFFILILYKIILILKARLSNVPILSNIVSDLSYKGQSILVPFSRYYSFFVIIVGCVLLIGYILNRYYTWLFRYSLYCIVCGSLSLIILQNM